MNNKILFVYSEKKRIELPQKLLTEYRIEVVPSFKVNIKKVILQTKPQIIMFDEDVKIKYVKYVTEKFKFIPVCVIGNFENPVKLEKFLNLGVTTINISLPEIEMVSTINNLLWFALSKEELWDEEYKLVSNELLKNKIFAVLKFVVSIVIVVLILFFLPKIYNMLAITQPLLYEQDISYITPSDITVFGNRYLINDWRVKNLFEYDETTKEIVAMYAPDKQFHSISVNEKSYAVAASMFTGLVYLFKYPNFLETYSTINFFPGKTVMSVHIDDENNIYILDNKSALYKYVLQDNGQVVFVSSVTITKFFPVDVCTVDKFLLFLDNNNNLYLTDKNNPSRIVLNVFMNKFFDSLNTKFISVDVSKEWVYMVDEQTKKVVKFRKKILQL